MTRREKIFDGIFLNYIEDKRFKVNSVSIKFMQPIQTDKNSSRALVFPVITRGTVNYPTEKELNKTLELLYCSSLSHSHSKIGNMTLDTLNSTFLRDKYIQDDTDVESGVMKILEDVILHPLLENGTFKADTVKTEVKQLADSERAAINNKGRYAINRCIRNMLCDDPFGYPANGTVEDIEKTTSEQIYEQYTNMLRCARIEIFVAGEVDFDRHYEFYRNIFSQVDRHYEEKSVITPISDHVKEVKKVREEDDVAQGKMVIGFRTFCSNIDSYEDFAPYIVGLNIFGSGSTSKLFNNVREKMSLCYYCSSFSVYEKGLMFVQSGVAMENEEKAFDAILDQLENMKKGDITDGEIENAKSDAISETVATFDYLQGIISWSFEKILVGKPFDSQQYIDSINRVTKEQIVEKFKSVELDTYYFLYGGGQK